MILMIFCLISRNSHNILVHKRRNTVACQPYHRHQLCYIIQAQDSYQRKRVVYTELFNWIKVDHHSHSIHRMLHLYKARSANKTYICSNRHRRRLTRRMLPHRRCIKAICPNTALYVNLELFFKHLFSHLIVGCNMSKCITKRNLLCFNYFI